MIHIQTPFVAHYAGFVAQLRRVPSDAELRRRLDEEGRIYAREWAAQGPAQALLAFYREFTLRVILRNAIPTRSE